MVKKTSCHYETRYGEARSTQLKRRVQELSQENEHLKNAIENLRTSSVGQAADLLQRIRTAGNNTEALRMINDSALLLSVTGSSVEIAMPTALMVPYQSGPHSDGGGSSVGSLGRTTSTDGRDTQQLSRVGSVESATDKSRVMKIGNLLTPTPSPEESMDYS